MKQKITRDRNCTVSINSLVLGRTKKIEGFKITKTQDGTICIKVSQKTSIYFQINNNSQLKGRPTILVDSNNRIITEDMDHIDLEKKQCNMTIKIVHLNSNNLLCLEQIRIIINSENIKIKIQQFKNETDSIPESFKFLNNEIKILQNGANICLQPNHHGEWIVIKLQEEGYSAIMQNTRVLVSAVKDFSDFERILRKYNIEEYCIDSGKISVNNCNKTNKNSGRKRFSWPNDLNKNERNKPNAANFSIEA